MKIDKLEGLLKDGDKLNSIRKTVMYRVEITDTQDIAFIIPALDRALQTAWILGWEARLACLLAKNGIIQLQIGIIHLIVGKILEAAGIIKKRKDCNDTR